MKSYYTAIDFMTAKLEIYTNKLLTAWKLSKGFSWPFMACPKMKSIFVTEALQSLLHC